MKLILSTTTLLLSTCLLAQVIFEDNFESGILKPEWNPQPNLEGSDGFVEIVDGEFKIGKNADGDFTRNGLDLNLNLEGKQDVYMTFDMKSFYDETHVQDAIYFSDDAGVTFHKAYDIKPADWCQNTWGQFPPLHIDAIVKRLGLELSDQFIIRFQQYGNKDFLGANSGASYVSGLIIDNVKIFSRTPVYAKLPYEENFDDGTGQFTENWQWSPADSTMKPLENITSLNGLVEIKSGAGTDNSYALRLGRNCDGKLSANAADLHLNLANTKDIYMTFDMKSFYDETHAQDAIYFSDDAGVTFHKAYDFKPTDWCQNTWGQFPPLHIDAIVKRLGLELSDQFIIRFQQYGNKDFLGANSGASYVDGLIIDNVKIFSRTPVYAKLPFEENFDDGTGEFTESWQWSPADSTMKPLENITSLNGLVELKSEWGTDNSFALRLGRNCDGKLSANAADLHLNLANTEDIYMTFDMKSFYDETHAQDAIYFSDDAGVTFHKAYDFKPADWCQNTWGQFPPLHIDAIVKRLGLELSDQFIIRFQQYGNKDFLGANSGASYVDGLIIDNVKIFSRTPVYAKLPFEENFDDGTGEFTESWQWSPADSTMKPLENITSLNGLVELKSEWGTDNSFALRLGRNCDGKLSANAADLHLNLANTEDIYMTFDMKSFYDETHAQDAIYFSDDAGVTFHKAYDFKPADWCQNTWGQFPPLHIDAIVKRVGLELSDQFIIRFQQYGNKDFLGETSGASYVDGLIIDNVKIFSRTPVYANLPYEENFDDGTGEFTESWQWSPADSTMKPLENITSLNGLVALTSGTGTDNSFALILGRNCDGKLSANAADLHLNLANAKDIYMTFDMKSFYDETHAQDAIYFSDDAGVTFHKAYDFKPTDWCQNTWGQFPPLHIDAIVKRLGLELSDQFIIRFQQYGNKDFLGANSGASYVDGLIIDNVKIFSRTPVYAKLPFEENFDDGTGEFTESWQWSPADSTMKPLENITSLNGLVALTSGTGTDNSFALILGRNCDGELSANAADLHLNLANAKDVNLSLDLRSFFDENHIQDGLFFSNDAGKSFKQIYTIDHTLIGSGDFVNKVFKLDSLISITGLTFTDSCIIRFQQYGNKDFSGANSGAIYADGLVIDNVKIEGDIVTSTQSIFDNYFQVYPNPVQGGKISLGINGLQDEIICDLIDEMGTVVWSQIIKSSTRNDNLTISLGDNISSGIYRIRLLTSEFSTVYPIYVIR